MPVPESHTTQWLPTALTCADFEVNPSFVVTGFAKPSPATLSTVTVPSSADTAYTEPSTPTATAALPPTFTNGLACVCNPSRPATPARTSTRCARTSPLAGSIIATVPPRTSTNGAVNTRFPVAVLGFGNATACSGANVPSAGLIGTIWLLAREYPTIAAPSWNTSRPDPLDPSESTPTSS
ncbi:hypothetical protein [Terrabacter sp. NPDC000476]|uniref:hypothetical protein n=1 Tax=Terrabacter sp. NPDC000476 TaxID=3154258 RepID=UPI00332D6CB9